ncbi:hypothetical protein AB0L80_43125 [Streptomyces sp. NPDC052069]|uniref:hypothetical protein n=1 Tax=Streptomyces sp. NPDC052069 TaxID=3154650 RepID=UPI00343CBF06
MTTQPRIALDDLTSDALDQLYDERDRYRTAWTSARSRVKRAKRTRDGELRWANGMWSDALRDLDRYRKAWTSARHRAAMYLQSNRNFAASLDNGHAVQLHAERVARSAAQDAATAIDHQLTAEAALARVRAALNDADWGGPDRHDVITEIRTALDQPQQPKAHQHVWTTVPASGAYGRLIGHTWTRCSICDQPRQPTTTAGTGTANRCSCGRPDPGPCTPCPSGTPSLHCACTCTPTDATPRSPHDPS